MYSINFILNIIIFYLMINVDHKCNEIKSELERIASIDNYITNDERELINTIVQQIRTYLELYNKTLEDGVITSLERVELFKSRLNVIQRTIEVIKKDFRVSNDEKTLFDKMQELLPVLDI